MESDLPQTKRQKVGRALALEDIEEEDAGEGVGLVAQLNDEKTEDNVVLQDPVPLSATPAPAPLETPDQQSLRLVMGL